jgi:SP family arabinose:H+ symporter-like MFS transporter
VSALWGTVVVAFGATPFVFFAVMMAAQFFVVLKFYPETARIRLEEIEHRV